MGSAAKAQEPTMEEILASIRRIIADDDGGGSEQKIEGEKKEERLDVSANATTEMNQDDIDAMLADFDAPVAAEPRLKAVKSKAAPSPSLAKTASSNVNEDDILELTAPAKKADEKQADVASISDVEFRDSDPFNPAQDNEGDSLPTPQEVKSAPSSAVQAVAGAELISPQANEAVASAFGSLANAIFAEKPRTMDDLVQDMLRPMLKSWLDENLPQMVETMVRTEIERVSRTRR
jgi:cell pole-organizing protein PopZ